MDLAVRVIAFVVLCGSGLRTQNRLVLPLFGPAPPPAAGGTGQNAGSWVTLAAEILFLSAISFLFLRTHWSPIALEALVSTLLLCLGPASYLLFRLQGIPWAERTAILSSLVLGLCLFGIHASWAVSEEGWRRAIGWTAAVLTPPAVVGGAADLLDRARSRPAILLGAGLALSAFAWLPLFVLEFRRMQKELAEEASLGLLPEADVRILSNPFRRWREPSYGRPDERRELIRSALMLAVARQQQRRRTGEKARLRQLEILTFRTRIRRILEVREARLSRLADEGVV